MYVCPHTAQLEVLRTCVLCYLEQRMRFATSSNVCCMLCMLRGTYAVCYVCYTEERMLYAPLRRVARARVCAGARVCAQVGNRGVRTPEDAVHREGGGGRSV